VIQPGVPVEIFGKMIFEESGYYVLVDEMMLSSDFGEFLEKEDSRTSL